MSTGMIFAILMIVFLLLGLMLGHPLAFTLGGLAVIFGFFGWGPECYGMFMNRIYMTVMNNYVLVAVPLFVLMANFLDKSGVMEGLFNSMRYLLGPIRGGVAMTVIVVATIFAACTGIIGASVVTIGLLAAPRCSDTATARNSSPAPSVPEARSASSSRPASCSCSWGPMPAYRWVSCSWRRSSPESSCPGSTWRMWPSPARSSRNGARPCPGMREAPSTGKRSSWTA